MTDEEKKQETSISPQPDAESKESGELSNEELKKVSGGTFNAFANFGDIKGESTDKDHKDWVML